MTWTTCKDWTDKDHERFLLLKAKEWHSCLKLEMSKAYLDDAETQMWFWLMTWAGWRAGERG